MRAMRLYDFRKDNKMPVQGGRGIISNWDKLIRPIETMLFCAGFNFSHGHFLKNVGYTVPSKGNGNIFLIEEPY